MFNTYEAVITWANDEREITTIEALDQRAAFKVAKQLFEADTRPYKYLDVVCVKRGINLKWIYANYKITYLDK